MPMPRYKARINSRLSKLRPRQGVAVTNVEDVVALKGAPTSNVEGEEALLNVVVVGHHVQATLQDTWAEPADLVALHLPHRTRISGSIWCSS